MFRLIVIASSKFKISRSVLSPSFPPYPKVYSTSTASSTHVEHLLKVTRALADFDDEKQSSATVERHCRQFCQAYAQLTREDGCQFLLELAPSARVDSSLVRQTANQLIQTNPESKKLLKLEGELRSALSPPINKIFSKIGQTRGGVKFLVDLRADVLFSMKSIDPTTQQYKNLQELSKNLKNLLAVWISVGFMSLSRVTWDSASSLLEKISEYEAVHPLRSWTDLKGRVGPYRRVFVYTHPSMAGEPLVVLHVALTKQISDSMSTVVKEFRAVNNFHKSAHGEMFQDSEEEIGSADTAIFYSITSTQAGLQGIELGNHLIKQAVAELKRELPGLRRFSTLSPIPGFRRWILIELTRFLQKEGSSPLLPAELQVLEELSPGAVAEEALHQLLKTGDWVGDQNKEKLLKPILLRLCARYLYSEKRRNKALDPVANFHIRNGAVLYRMNWLADPSARGLTNSCGIMVNYRYFLDDVEKNSTEYLRDHTIAVDQLVVDHLEQQ